jgi:hypothetical protein
MLHAEIVSALIGEAEYLYSENRNLQLIALADQLDAMVVAIKYLSDAVVVERKGDEEMGVQRIRMAANQFEYVISRTDAIFPEESDG